MDHIANKLADWQKAATATETKHCEEHGQYTSTITMNPFTQQPIHESPCPTCRAIQKKSQKQREKNVRLIEARKQAWQHANLPATSHTKTFDNIKIVDTHQQSKVINTLRQYAANIQQSVENGTSMIFSGPSGTGKTHCAIAIINEAIRQHAYRCYYIRESEYVVRMMQRLVYNRNDDPDTVQRECLRYDLFVLDCVGLYETSAREKRIIFDLIDRRAANNLATILVTNLNIDDLRQHISRSAVNRFGSKNALLSFDWKSVHEVQGL